MSKDNEVKTIEGLTSEEAKNFKFPQDQNVNFKFTRTLMKRITDLSYPVAKDTIFKDLSDDARGLCVRVLKSGRAVYMVQKRIKSLGGSAKKRNIATVGEMSLETARKRAGEFLDWMSEGLDPIDVIKKRNETGKIYTLNDAYNLFMNERKIDQVTIDRYERVKDVISFVHIRKKLDWKNLSDDLQITNTNVYKGNTANLKSLLDANLNDISSQSILRIHRNITKSHGHGDNDAHTEGDRVIQFIGSLYELAIQVYNELHDDNNFIKRNPVRIMRQGKGHWNNPGGKTRRRREALDTSHIKAHYDAICSLKTLKNNPDPNNKKMKYTHKPIPGAVRAHYFLRFMFWTGWRPGDTARIEWDQIEEENGMMTISWDDTEAVEKLKSGEVIYKVPLNQQAIAVIKELKEIRDGKIKAAKDGDTPLPKNYDYNHVFLNVLEDNHINPNQHHYEAIMAKIAGVKHYPTSIYRKTFLSYGEHLNINIYSLKRLVFHTQNYYDVTSGYISTNRERLRDITEELCSFILSLIDPQEYEFKKQSGQLTDTKIETYLYKDLQALFKEKADEKINDLIRMALAIRALEPVIYNKFDSTTTENAEFEDSDFED